MPASSPRTTLLSKEEHAAAQANVNCVMINKIFMHRVTDHVAASQTQKNEANAEVP